MVVLAAMLAFGADPPVDLVTPTQAWEDVYLRNRTVSHVGLAMPVIGVGVSAAVIGLFDLGDSEAAEWVELGPGIVGFAAGLPTLAVGTGRQCRALRKVGLKRNCGLPAVTWLAMGGTAAMLPVTPFALFGLPVTYLVGVAAFADDEIVHARRWPESVTVHLVPTVDRRGTHGFAFVGTF